jgi:hypothetical protein
MSIITKIATAILFVLVFLFLVLLHGFSGPWPMPGGEAPARVTPTAVTLAVEEVVAQVPLRATTARPTVHPTWTATMRCIAHRESRFTPTARRHDGESASGLFGFTDGTWHRYKGYAHAWQAPAAVQIARFVQVWNGGKGRSNWYWKGHRQCW